MAKRRTGIRSDASTRSHSTTVNWASNFRPGGPEVGLLEEEISNEFDLRNNLCSNFIE
jgi:hypothetical protein